MMFDARDLLGQLLQSQARGSTGNRLEHAFGTQRPGSGSPLGDLLGGLLGGRAGGGGLGAGTGGGLGGGLGSGGGGDLLGTLSRHADAALGAGTGDAVRSTLQDRNQLAMGGLAGLAGAVLGGRRGGMGGAVGAGLLALLGSLAFSAMKNRPARGGAAASPAPAPEQEAALGLKAPETPAEEAAVQHTALLAIRAMISAAKADGAIDGGEMGRIMGKLSEHGTDGEARDFVMSELQKPLDLDALIRDVKTKEMAIQVYGASLLAIEVDTPAERDYLQRLAAGLGLDAETVAHVHEALGVSPLQ